ncbi:hypothetical protein JW935_11710 [candidate division KSB1 bacterium]|nr:hypothetical protein [candidate division KSB1 bacterium]
MARRATILKQNINDADFYILTDAGGYMRGIGDRSLLLTDYLLKGMKWMGYSAVNISARDLNNGGDYIKKCQKELGLDFIAANVVYKDTGKLFGEPYVVKDIKAFSDKKLPFKKLRIGIVGMTDARTQLFSNSINEPMLESIDPVPVAAKLLPEIRKKADLVILLYYGRFDNVSKILEQSDDIDVVVLGQEYYRAASYREKKPEIVGVSSMGKYCGILSLDLDKEKNVIDSKIENIALSEDIADDPMFVELIDEYKEAEQEFNKKITEQYRTDQKQNVVTPPQRPVQPGNNPTKSPQGTATIPKQPVNPGQ